MQEQANGQSDHDLITELKVLVGTLIKSVDSLSAQIKEQAIQTAATQAAMEARWTTNHNGLESRVRALEDKSASVLPEHAILSKTVATLQSDMEAVKANENKFLGGWKTFVFFGSVIAGTAGLIISIVDIYVHAAHQ